MLICSGDFIGPSMISNVTHGQHMVDILNILGVDFGCIGNHEFDYGVENLEKRLDDSQSLWLLSNIVRAGHNNKSIAGTSTHILTRWNGIRVGWSKLCYMNYKCLHYAERPHFTARQALWDLLRTGFRSAQS